jgi:hypothetical protein
MYHYALPLLFLLPSCATNPNTEATPVKVNEAEPYDSMVVTLASEKDPSGEDKNIELSCGEFCDAPPNTREIMTQQIDIRREQRTIRHDLNEIKLKLLELKEKKNRKKKRLLELKEEQRKRRKPNE